MRIKTILLMFFTLALCGMLLFWLDSEATDRSKVHYEVMVGEDVLPDLPETLSEQQLEIWEERDWVEARSDVMKAPMSGRKCHLIYYWCGYPAGYCIECVPGVGQRRCNCRDSATPQ